jgi:hypothetical protein
VADYFHPDHDFYAKQNVTPPSVAGHGTEEDVRSKLEPLKLHSWRQEGNLLIAQSELGEVVNHLPTDTILSGLDDKGMPIFAKVKL